MKPEFLFHNTVAAVIEQDGKFLLVKEEVAGKVVYNQPAGHLDGDESLSDAAIREALEETSYHFTPDYLTGIYLCQKPDANESYLRVAFSGSAKPSNPPLPIDDKIIEAVWLSTEEILSLPKHQLRSEMVTLCIKDYLAGKRFSLDLLHYLHSPEPLVADPSQG